MRPNGKGTNGYRPYRGDFSRERMAAASYDLEQALARAKARKAAKFGGLSHNLIVVDEADGILKEQSK